MNIYTTPLRTMVVISETNGWAAGMTGLYLGHRPGWDTVKVGFVDEHGKYTGEFTTVARTMVRVR